MTKKPKVTRSPHASAGRAAGQGDLFTAPAATPGRAATVSSAAEGGAETESMTEGRTDAGSQTSLAGGGRGKGKSDLLRRGVDADKAAGRGAAIEPRDAKAKGKPATRR